MCPLPWSLLNTYIFNGQKKGTITGFSNYNVENTLVANTRSRIVQPLSGGTKCLIMKTLLMLCKFPSAVCLLLLSTTNWTTARCGKHHPHNSRAKRVSDAHVFQEYMAHHTSTPTGSLLLPPPLPLNPRSGKESRLKYIICTGSVKVTTTLIPYTYLICVKIIKISIIKFLSR